MLSQYRISIDFSVFMNDEENYNKYLYNGRIIKLYSDNRDGLLNQIITVCRDKYNLNEKTLEQLMNHSQVSRHNY